MRNFYNKLLVLVILIPMGYLMMDLFDIILKSGTIDIIYPSYNYKLIYSCAYGATLLITLIIIPNLTRVGMIYLLIFSLFGFGLNCLGAKVLSYYSISPMVKNSVSPSFSLYFFYSVYILGLLSIIEILRKIGFEKIFEKIHKSNLNINLRFSRLFAFVIDWGLVLIIYWVLTFSRIIILSPLLIFFIAFSYRIVFETLYYQTIGKRIMNNLTIVRNDLTTPNFGQIIKRNFSRLIFIYMVPILWNGQGLHDMISKTEIIKNAR